MTNTYRKKLIEVALPLKAINEASAREKSIRHGHPSTLHLWWARRPLAACRAVLFSSLVDDPDSDPEYQKAGGAVDEDAASTKRADLFNLIEELVQWENSNNPEVIRSARAEIARCVASRKLEMGELKADQELAPGVTVSQFIRKCHCRPVFVATETQKKKKDDRQRFRFETKHLPPEEVVNTFLAEHAPPVLDPFAGGGSIPLEAQRLGLRAYASDLNPVPVLINKALIEIPPKFANMPPVNPESRKEAKGKKKKQLLETKEWKGAAGLAEDVRYYGKWMRDEAEKQIGHLYPKVKVTAEMTKDRPDLEPYVGQELTVIAWIWARTVTSPNPACGNAQVPLARSFSLSTKKGREVFVEPVKSKDQNTYSFVVHPGLPANDFDPKRGTVNRNGATCLFTGDAIDFHHIRSEGKSGRLGAKLMAIACEGSRCRVYLSPDGLHENAARVPIPNNIPETPIPNLALGFRIQLYGMDRHFKLFTNRQLVALTTLADLVPYARDKLISEAKDTFPTLDAVALGKYADGVATYLAMLVSRYANYCSTLSVWSSHAKDELAKQVFMRQALQMTWDFAETNPFGTSGGTWDSQVEWLTRAISVAGPITGNVRQLDATDATIPDLHPIYSTDPPYYDNIGYADLSDYFYIWLRRSLSTVYPELLSTVLTPKDTELIATPHRHEEDWLKAQTYFENGFRQAFSLMRKEQHQDCPLTIFYAFKQSEEDDISSDSTSVSSTGWETMLEGVVASGLSVTATLPMRTELTANLKKSVAALASSIVLACRLRSENAPLATRKEFITALRRELPDALRSLQQGSIAPVDLAQSAIGPGMAVFTRYSKVLESDGSPMTVRTALGLINQALDEVLAEQEGEFDGDTRWALAWFEQFGMEAGPFGDAETLSKAKNTAIHGLVEAGIIAAKSGKVRLLARDELPSNWNPTTDNRLTVWEVTQHLIHRLDEQGESGAAELVSQLGHLGEIARDLAYRLYNICERKKWAQEALAYNSLVVAWPEITKLALAQRTANATRQGDLF